MAKLIYYAQERAEFPEVFGKENSINKEYSLRLCKKLIRHFKINILESSDIVFNSKLNHSFARFYRNFNSCSLVLQCDLYLSIGIICHELAHIHNWQFLGNSGHNRKHYKIMKRMIKYCLKKEYNKLQQPEVLETNGVI